MIKRRLLQAAMILLILGVWEFACRAQLLPNYILPSFSEVAVYLVGAIQDLSILTALFITMKRLLIGYIVSLIIGAPLGLLCARWRSFSSTIGLLAVSAQGLPSVCWVPFALMVFGQSETAMLFVVIMGSIGSIILAAESSLQRVPKLYIEAARTMGSSGLHTVMHVLLPAALPEFFSGMKQGWAFAWRSLMAAEIYVSVLTGFGLGQLLHFGRELHAMDQVIGVMVVILGIGLVLDKLFFSPIQKRLHVVRGM